LDDINLDSAGQANTGDELLDLMDDM